MKFLGEDGQLLTAGKSGKVPPGQIVGNTSTAETFMYFYHPDLPIAIGMGSTSYVTDASGEVYQHLEYFAFGETFVEEHSNTDRTPYLFNGKELDEETGLYYYGARYYDARTSVWQSVDPAADEFLGWSPYNYTFNNPLRFNDPDGRKPDPPIVWINSKIDPIIYNAAIKQEDDGAIHIFAHGNPRGISAIIDGKKVWINSPKKFDEILSKQSESWKNRKEGDNLTVVLHSCRTGRDPKNGKSFTQKLSEEFKDVTFIAPDERDVFQGDPENPKNSTEKGPFKAKFADEYGDYNKQDKNGEYIKGTSDEPGSWLIFKGGKKVEEYEGGWSPKPEPGFWDKLFYKKEE